MTKLTNTNKEYNNCLKNIKNEIRSAQIKANISVCRELLMLYYKIGQNIVEIKAEARWGTSFYTRIRKDLKEEFNTMNGFSETNLRYMTKFYLFYNQEYIISPQAGEKFRTPQKAFPPQLGEEIEKLVFSIPWGHQKYIIDRCKSIEEALFYVNKTIEYGWSRNMLMNYQEAHLFASKGKAITNFQTNLPMPQSDLAQQVLKDPYNFDFLTLRERYNERELEEALTTNITNFLLELGSGFAYLGKQKKWWWAKASSLLICCFII